MLPPLQRSQRNQGFFKPLLCRTEIFKKPFLPYYVYNIEGISFKVNIKPNIENMTILSFYHNLSCICH